MSAKPAQYWAPLTFDLTLPQVEKIEAVRRARGFKTASEVIRVAIAQFDFDSYEARRPRHRQLSVRFAPDLREKLRRHARRKNVSIGELLRQALESLATVSATKAGGRKPAAKSRR